MACFKHAVGRALPGAMTYLSPTALVAIASSGSRTLAVNFPSVLFK